MTSFYRLVIGPTKSSCRLGLGPTNIIILQYLIYIPKILQNANFILCQFRLKNIKKTHNRTKLFLVFFLFLKQNLLRLNLIILKYLGYIIFSFLYLNVQAQTSIVENDLLAKLNAIKTLSAQFTQVMNAKHKKLSTAKGTMLIKRPGLFRWETNYPRQILMADGKHIYVYDKDLEQVTIKPQNKALRGTPALFLSEVNDSLLDDFDVKKDNKINSEVFHLRAKSAHPAFIKMDLVFKGSVLNNILLEDQLGQITQLNLINVQQNLALSSKTFVFKIPRGVDVIRE